MTFDAYADLCRSLTAEERSTLFEALDSLVPEGGCVGPQSRVHKNDEVYFTVEAASKDEAARQATHYVAAMLKAAALDVDYTIDVPGRGRNTIRQTVPGADSDRVSPGNDPASSAEDGHRLS